MIRACMSSVWIAFLLGGPVAAEEMTVEEYLVGPALGDVQTTTEVKGEASIQATTGRHKDHRVLKAVIPLCEKAETPYTLSYNACLEIDKHPGAVDLVAREGLSGLGMSAPTGANWYAGGCIDVVINGKGMGAYRPALERIVHASDAVTARATWSIHGGKVALSFTQMPGGECCYVKGVIDCPEVRSLVVRLNCFPSGYTEPRERVAWTASASQVGPGTLLVPPKDFWVLFGDVLHDRAKDKRGQGTCAVMFPPTQVQGARVKVTGYPVSTEIAFRPETKEIHLTLWEFPKRTNNEALAHMREIGGRLKASIGRPALAAVQTEGVPERTVVLDGRPTGTIYLRKGAQDREVEVATELQDYIAKATGAVLPIVREPDEPKGHAIRIAVREPQGGEGTEAFTIKVGPKQTDVIGNSPLAALYGAYELLERGVGVRWYLPGPMGEVVPMCKTLTLPPLDVTQGPSFPMRWIGRGKWALRNKQNRCDDGFLVYPGIYHTQNRILPHKQYFKERPDYYAMINGKRSAEHECKLCYSNPDCVREVARNMAKMLDENPSIDLISLSPTDGQMWCECDGCRAMDPEGVVPNTRQPRDAAVPNDRAMSRRSLLFYNAVAAELRKAHPRAKMLVGAYNVYNWPPKDPNVKADPMLAVIITHYEDYCMAHPVPDPTCPLNQRYVQLIKEWQDMGCAIYYYEYYWKVNWLDLPWPIVHSIKGDMPWYKEQGHEGVYTQYTESNIWTLFPGHYVAARLLWDVNADVDAIVGKMYDDLFGAAAPYMKQYYALMEKQMAECGEHFPGQGLRFGPAVFTDEIRAELHEHYNNAAKAVNLPQVPNLREDTREKVRFRLRKIGTSLEYVDRLMRYRDLVKATTSEKDREKALAFAEEALKVGEDLVNEIRTDREKWGGVVSMSVVGSKHYLGRGVDSWRKAVAKRRARQLARRAVTVDKIAPLPTTWRFSLDRDDAGQKEGWFKTEFDDSTWKPIEIGRTWEEQGYEYDGFAWYRVMFHVKPGWLKAPVAVHFGAVDGEAWVYWNGTLLGHHEGWDEPFTLSIKADLIRAEGPNVIAVRVYDGANAGGIYRPVYLVKRK